MQLHFTLSITRFCREKKEQKIPTLKLPKHSTDAVHCMTGDCQRVQHSRESIEHKTKYLTIYKRRPGNSASFAHAWVLRSGHSVSVTCMAEAEILITTTWRPKGRKRMLLRQPESYSPPDLLAYEINKRTATACECICVTVCILWI